MKTHTSVWKFGCGLLLCLLGLQGARAQKQDVELDATAIDFHSLFVGRNELFPDNVHPSDYIGTYTNEAGCRDQLVMKLTLAEEKPSEKAQKALPKVYDEDINPLKQIDKAVAKAKKERKNVICQVGGNWCPWCLRFADFITNDTSISKVIDENFVYIHVNYNPRKSESAEKQQQAKALMERLNNCGRFGFPVFVVLDENGKVMHIQDSSFLEEGQGYNQEKVLRFFKGWTPKSIETQQ